MTHQPPAPAPPIDHGALIRRLTEIRLQPAKHSRADREHLAGLEAHCREHGHTGQRHAGRCVRCGVVPVEASLPLEEISERIRRLRANPSDPPEHDEQAHDATMRQVHGARRASGLPAWHGRRGLADLDPLPEQEAAYGSVGRWVADQRKTNPKPRGLLLLGPVGSGKTTLAAAAACDLREPDGCLFRSVRQLICDAKAAMGGRDEPLREAARARVLILDDLGSVRDTPWRVDELRGLLDMRHDGGRVTVATANLTEAQLGEMLGPRSWSRLRSTCDVVVVAGPDRRQR